MTDSRVQRLTAIHGILPESARFYITYLESAGLIVLDPDDGASMQRLAARVRATSARPA